ncbi:MAG: M23 family metallopeptidase [Armatimonadetes bacterium]|nr:M23 family metallopeptidase [Armatimonadota bacterium]
MLSASMLIAAPDVSIVPKAPRVGDAIFLQMTPEREVLRAACSWAGKSYGLLPDGEMYGAVMPVPLTTKAGETHAVLYWKYVDGGMGKLVLPLEVKARQFGVQHLKLSKSQESTYSAPETKRERELIGKALDLVGPRRLWSGSFLRPVEGRISTAFGLQRYVNGNFSYRHRGIDIACPEGTPVKATASGVVSLADESFVLHGKTVIVDHGQGVSSLYIHLSGIAVSPGECVEQGQVLGYVGSTGVATGPHLHFAVYVHHEAVDPFYWTDLPVD